MAQRRCSTIGISYLGWLMTKRREYLRWILPFWPISGNKKARSNERASSIGCLAVSYSRMANATLPSALQRFTSEFGMGSGGSTALLPPGKIFNLKKLI